MNPLWIERAEKIERVRGAEAMGLANVSSRPDFWNIVDLMKPKIVAKKMPRPKSSQGISMKGGIAKLRDKARAKAIDQMCNCPPWAECNHDPTRDGGLWSDRLRKLSGLGQTDAMGLLSHIGTQNIWDVVDQLADPSPPMSVVANEGTTLHGA